MLNSLNYMNKFGGMWDRINEVDVLVILYCCWDSRHFEDNVLIDGIELLLPAHYEGRRQGSPPLAYISAI